MENKTIKFDGKDYHYVVKPYSVFKGMQIQTKLLPLFAGIIPLLTKGEDIGMEDMESVFESAILKDEDGVGKLITKMLEKDTIFVDENGSEKRITKEFIDTHFRMNYMELYKLTFEVGKFQFSDFFKDGMLGLKG